MRNSQRCQFFENKKVILNTLISSKIWAMTFILRYERTGNPIGFASDSFGSQGRGYWAAWPVCKLISGNPDRDRCGYCWNHVRGKMRSHPTLTIRVGNYFMANFGCGLNSLNFRQICVWGFFVRSSFFWLSIWYAYVRGMESYLDIFFCCIRMRVKSPDKKWVPINSQIHLYKTLTIEWGGFTWQNLVPTNYVVEGIV